MSRFYNTSKGGYTDFMFKPNYEMMEKVLDKKNQDVDNILGGSEILTDAYNKVNHLNIESDVNIINERKKYYDEQTGKVTEAVMANVLDANAYMPQLSKLKDEMTADLTTGVTAKVQGRYQAFQGMLEENKGLSETDPTTYNQMFSYYYNQVKEGAAADKNYVFSPQKFVGKPEIFKEELTKMLKDMEAYESTEQAGMYLIDRKLVSKQRVREIAISRLMADPKYKGYLSQQLMIGEGQGFINSDIKVSEFMEMTPEQQANNMISPIRYYNTATGNYMKIDEIETLTDKERQSIITEANPEFRFAPDIKLLEGIYAYEQVKVRGDDVAISQNKIQADFKMLQMREAGLKTRLQMTFDNDAARDEWKFGKEKELIEAQAKGDAVAATKADGELTQDAVLKVKAEERLGRIGGVAVTAKKDREDIVAYSKGTSPEIKGIKGADGVVRYELTANASPEAAAALSRLKQSRAAAMEAVPEKEEMTITGTNGVNFKIKKREFLKFHGDRVMSEAAIAKTMSEFVIRENEKRAKDNKSVETGTPEFASPFYDKARSFISTGDPSKNGTPGVVSYKDPSGPIAFNARTEGVVTPRYSPNIETKKTVVNPRMVGSTGSSYTLPTTTETLETVNANNITNFQREFAGSTAKYYNENQSANTGAKYMFTPVATTQSNTLSNNIVNNHLAYQYFDKDGMPMLDVSRDDITTILNDEPNLYATGVNAHATVALQTQSGITIIPNKATDADRLIQTFTLNAALEGSVKGDYIFDNFYGAKAAELESTMKGVGSVSIRGNSTKTKVGYRSFSGEEYRIREVTPPGGRTQIMVLDANKDVSVLRGSFYNYGDLVQALWDEKL
jgi:hypothetical protein